MEFRKADLSDLDLLLRLRIDDLYLFSDQEVTEETRKAIQSFYQRKMTEGNCTTWIGYENGDIAATATIYFYEVLPSNENPKGIVGQCTSVWVDTPFRHRGIAQKMMYLLIEEARGKAGIIILNSSEEAVSLYVKLGFIKKERTMVLSI